MQTTLKSQKTYLSAVIQHNFYHAANAINQLRPLFYAACTTYKAKLPAKWSKGGQALWDKPGTRYGGENMTVGLIRRMRRLWRASELRSMKLQRS